MPGPLRASALDVSSIFRIERHDLDRSTGIRPADHPDNPTGHAQHLTLRDELAEGRRAFRRDILLVNARQPHCPTCTCETDGTFHQFAVEVRADGSLTGPDEAFRLISDADLEWAKAEAARMVETARTHNVYGRAFLRGWRS